VPRPVVYGDAVNWSHPLNRGRVLWLTGLPQKTGSSTWYDAAGRNHGTLTSGPVWTPTGYGAGLTFSNNYVDVAAAAAFDVPALTVAALFYPTQTGGNGIFERSTNGSVNSGSLLFLESGNLNFRVGRAGGTDTATAGAVSTNAWHFAAGTLAGTTVSAYLDGAAPATAALGGALNTGTGAARVGSLFGVYLFAGLVADVHYYSRALSAAEVAALRDQMLRGHPDTLRRPKPWSFGVAAVTADLPAGQQLL
jgi:hypothetical protein